MNVRNTVLLGIITLACIFRFSYINWDDNFHMHPDERAIILTVLELDFPDSLRTFFSVESPWNPHFFAYGSLPFYLLKVLSTLHPSFATYDGLAILGRFLSALLDVGIVMLLYFLGKRFFNKGIGLIGAFFYSTSVLPIQLSHFYAVDTPLTFFSLLTLFFLIHFYQKPSLRTSILLGFFFACALATKISAIVLLVSFAGVIVLHTVWLIEKHAFTTKVGLQHTKRFFLYAMSTLLTTSLTFIVLMPYAVIDFTNFWTQTLQQQAMTRDAFTFPYTLQYVGKLPYLYEITNLSLFGLGPVIASICSIGTLYVVYSIVKMKTKVAPSIILFLFFVTYFIIVGRFAIGFMRYMLPLYPLLCLFGGIVTYHALSRLRPFNTFVYMIVSAVLITSCFIWPLSFMNIYRQPNTRIQASNWILSAIPPGSTLAIEHWDDAIPIYGQERYTMVTLPLYDQDTPEKWQVIRSYLQTTDYIILASHRLYVPLQKLTNCTVLPPGKCYLQTAQYYQALFSGSLGFEKVKEFSVTPEIPYLGIPLSDFTADESFTVYDHPKILIFKKIHTP